MSIKPKQAKRFRPERPIYLSENNTGYKTQDEVIFAVEQLRDLGWLCAYNENHKPFHMSFNDELEFQQFKNDCQQLSITLKSPLIKQEDLETILYNEKQTNIEPEAEETEETKTGGIKKIKK